MPATIPEIAPARKSTAPVRHHATYRSVPCTARLVPGGYTITVDGYAGSRLVSYRDSDLVLGGLVDLAPSDPRPLWQQVCDHTGRQNNGRI